jgi:hypothetical protein
MFVESEHPLLGFKKTYGYDRFWSKKVPNYKFCRNFVKINLGLDPYAATRGPDQESAKYLDPDPDSVNTDSKHWVKEIPSRGIRKFLMAYVVIVKMFCCPKYEGLMP